MEAIQLRDYQIRSVNAVFAAWKQGYRSVVLVAPTGMGKRIIALWLMDYAQKANRKVLFVGNRRLLISQAQDDAEKFGLDYGIIMANSDQGNLGSSNQFASIQTLESWYFYEDFSSELSGKNLPNAHLVIIDEGHAEGERYKQLLQLYPDAKFLVLTATPVGAEGKPIVPAVFEKMVEPVKNSELIRDGYLLRTTVFAPSEPYIKGVSVEGGREYNQVKLGKAVRSCTVFADVFKEWEPYSNRATVCFVPGIAFGRDLSHEWNNRLGHTLPGGSFAFLIEAKTPPAERQRIYALVREHGRGVLLSYDVLREGFDLPVISCGLDLQPNTQLRTFWQKVGRIKRTHPGQSDAVWLDFAGNYWRFPHPNDDPVWPEGCDATTQDVIRDRREQKKEAEPFMCPKCFGAGTLILTSKGWCEIESISVGDLVMTHRGNWQPVTNTHHRVGRAERICGTGHSYGLVTTPEHPFMDRTGNWIPSSDATEWASPVAFGESRQDLQDAEAACPAAFTEGFMRFVGCWLGDGCVSRGIRKSRRTAIRGEVIICCGKSQQELDRAVETVEGSGLLGGRIRAKAYEGRTAYNIPVYGVKITNWLTNQFGQYCHGKDIPPWTLAMPHRLRLALLSGYLEADGCYGRDGWSACSVSKRLSLSVKLLAQSLGYGVRMRKIVGVAGSIEGRSFNALDSWKLEIAKITNAPGAKITSANRFVIGPIRRRQVESSQDLYDLSVQDDHSYIAEGIVVHNCNMVRTSGSVCPNCKHEASQAIRRVRMEDGKLQEMPAENPKHREITEEQRAFNDWQGTLFGALYKGWTYAQCAKLYKDRTGKWPKQEWPGVYNPGTLESKRRPKDEHTKATLYRWIKEDH